MEEHTISPYQRLRELHALGLSRGTSLPPREEQRSDWHCIAFVLNGARLLTDMEQITEVVELPRLARVPGAKDWLLGVANLRGQLVTVIDLKALVYGIPTVQVSRTQRLLVAETHAGTVGFLVERVVGLTRLAADQMVESEGGLDLALQPFIARSYRLDGEATPFVDVSRLLASEQLLSAAA